MPATTAFAVAVLVSAIGATAAFLWNADGLDFGAALTGAGAITAALWAAGASMQSRVTIAEATFLVVAAAACAASAFGDATLFAALKPVATALAVVAVALRTAPAQPKALILTALVASLVGDALLMREDWFIFGLAAFLLAHLIYIAFLWRDARLGRTWGASLVVALYAAGMLAYLWPHIGGGLKAPVATYVIAISTMLALALSRALALRTRAALLVALGALAFVVSDSALALTLFAGAGDGLRLVVLPTYWLAQALISFHGLPREWPALGAIEPAAGTWSQSRA